jgi:hypothetical protein
MDVAKRITAVKAWKVRLARKASGAIGRQNQQKQQDRTGHIEKQQSMYTLKVADA